MHRNHTENHSPAYPRVAGTLVSSAAELASRIDGPAFERVRHFYSVRSVQSRKLLMNEAGWTATAQAMGASREAVEDQLLVFIRDRYAGNEAIVNAIRSRRFVPTAASATRASLGADVDASDCRWCGPWHVGQAGLWADEWDQVRSEDLRVGSRPNWARQSTVSGLVFGDEGMHRLDCLSEGDFISLYETAQGYIERSLRHCPRVAYFIVFLNGGPKSAGSVEHAHLQIVGREDRHFAYPETIAGRCPGDYWSRLRDMHRELGLEVSGDRCSAWASLAPVKERDVTAISETLAGGARFVYRQWRALAAQGTRNFSLAAILTPTCLGQESPERFARWPNVVWRFVDRGDPQVRHSDIGTMELFGSGVVGADPFEVARWLRAD